MSSRTHGRLLTRGGFAAVSLLSLIAVCPTYAQAPVATVSDPGPETPESSASGQVPKRWVTIPSDTQLEVVLGQQLSTRTGSVGDTFQLSLARSVVIDGETVLAEGTPLLRQIVDLMRGGEKGGQLTLVLHRLLLEKAGAAIPIQSRPLTLKRKTSIKVGAVVLSTLFVPELIGGLVGGWGEAKGSHKGRFIGLVTGGIAASEARYLSTRDLVLAPKKKLVFRLIGDVTD